MVSDPSANSVWQYYLRARGREHFFGRQAPLGRIVEIARDCAAGANRTAGVDGPTGCGKSELIRQAALRMGPRSQEAVPIYLDLGGIGRQDNPQMVWDLVATETIRQCLAHLGRIELDDRRWLNSDPRTVSELCLQGGLEGVVAFPGLQPRRLAESWAYLLRECRREGLPASFVLIDGTADWSDSTRNRLLKDLMDGAGAAGVSIVAEVSPAVTAALGEQSMEIIRLAPLTLEEATGLVRSAASPGRWEMPVEQYSSTLERLGPWPGWIHDWAAILYASEAGQKPKRMAENAYVRFIEQSAWTLRLRRDFENKIAPSLREGALRLVRRAAQAVLPLSTEEASTWLGGNASTLEALAELHLIRRAGTHWQGPAWSVLADWAAFQLDATAGSGEAALNLLMRLLESPRKTGRGERPLGSREIERLLSRFDSQRVPEVLFQYPDYHEALGRLDESQRREAVMNATHTMRLPEVVGVARRQVQGDQLSHLQRIEFLYARGYRDGKYQRSHEITWIVADLTRIRSLTSPEVQEILGALRQLEKQLGTGQWVPWLIINDGASAEAIESLKKEKLYCSNAEQVVLIDQMLNALPEQPGRSENSELSVAPRQPVIELKPEEPEPMAESSNLRLPARADSEIIAALMAEKVAIRADFGASAAGQVKTAVLEGVLNAIEHSPNPEKMIDLEFRVTREALEILIENEGRGFDPQSVPEPDARAKLSAANKRGWGIMLMKKFMDEVGYEPCERGTRLRLIKRRARTDRSSTTQQAERGKAGL